MDKYYLKYLKYNKKYLELKGAGAEKIIIPEKFIKEDYTISERLKGDIKGNFSYDVKIVHNDKMIYIINFNQNNPDGKIIFGNNQNPYDKFLNYFMNMAKERAAKKGIKNNLEKII